MKASRRRGAGFVWGVTAAALAAAALCLGGCGLKVLDNRDTQEESRTEAAGPGQPGGERRAEAAGPGQSVGESLAGTGGAREPGGESLTGAGGAGQLGRGSLAGTAGTDGEKSGQTENDRAGAARREDGKKERRLRARFPEPGDLSVKIGADFENVRDKKGTGEESRVCQGVPAGNGTLEILVPAWFVRDGLEISVLECRDSRILLEQGETWAVLEPGSRVMWTGQGSPKVIPGAGPGKRYLKQGPEKREDSLYIPLEAVCEAFDYEADMEPGSLRARLEDRSPGVRVKVPAAYDYRENGRAAKVKDQGSYGTCWSFASLTALETAMGPRERLEFSADHMSLRNSFSLDQSQGGEYTMSMAYLLAWQGPVLEAEDPYGDHVSPEGLAPAVHVQEIRMLPSRDFGAVKKAVFLWGGVQSSLYTSIADAMSRSPYYSVQNSSYCYQGEEIPNHDVVIVGWDDHYPKEKFNKEPPGDGAFLCVSSWGQNFGDGGYFYVSYYDSNIGGNGLVYTGIEKTDNYHRIYQSDLCGWVGQVGYSRQKAWGANVYRAEEPEDLAAVGFYATKKDTSYSIYLARPGEGEADFGERKLIAQGIMEYGGFYTVTLKEPQRLEAGERFAIILEAETPEAVHPLAVEYRADEMTAEADVTDGEGYISYDGQSWERLEERYQCNLCLKGYTRRKANAEHF